MGDKDIISKEIIKEIDIGGDKTCLVPPIEI